MARLRRKGLTRLAGGVAAAGIVVLAAVLVSCHSGVTTGKSAHPTTSAGVSIGTTSTALPSGASDRAVGTNSTPVATFPPSKLPRLLPRIARPVEVPILMYHYVDYSPPPAGPYAAGLTVPTAQFEAEMNYLAANGYHPITIEQIYAALAGQGRLPSKPVALTFDDGGLDDYTVAFPILQEHHFLATFFVITGLVGRPQYMNWDQLRAMYGAGMAIESHTVHHRDLRTLPAPLLAEELDGSRATLAQQLGEDAVILAYPAGGYDATVIAATRTAGYLAAVTTHRGDVLDPFSPYTWPRLRMVPGESLAGFARILGQTAPVSRV